MSVTRLPRKPPPVKSARLDWIKCLLESDLPTGAKLVGLVIASHTSPLGDHAWPGRERIASLGSMSLRVASAHIHALEVAGWILVTRRNVGGTRLTNAYQLAVPGWDKPQTEGDER